MESRNERHVTDPMELARLAQAVRTLMSFGYRINAAIYEVAHANGLTKADTAQLIQLI